MKRPRMVAGVAAVAALGVLAYRIGPAEIAAQFLNLRIVLPIVLMTGLARLLLQTRAWKIALRAEGIEAPQHRLLAVRLASQAAGYLTTLGPVVTESSKLFLLGNPTGMAAAIPATLVETGMYWFTTVIMGLAGCCAAAILIADAPAIWAAAAIFGVAFALLAGRRSLLSPLARAVGARAPGWLLSAERAELRIRSFRDRQPRAAGEVLALESIAQLVTLVEVAAVLWGVGIRPAALQVLAIEAAGRIVKILCAWIPGRIGADEGGAAASFALLGLAPAAGLTLAVARRVRDLLWCTAGAVWAVWSSAQRPTPRSRTSPVSLCTEEP